MFATAIAKAAFTLFSGARFGFFLGDFRRRRHADRAALEQLHLISRSASSGRLGDARLGTLEDARRAGLLGGPGGVLVGFLDGHALWYGGPSHLCAFMRMGAGKASCYIIPNVALCDGESFLVLDSKRAETPFATARRRAVDSGQPLILLNFWNLLGQGSHSLNILDGLVEAARQGQPVMGLARAVAKRVVTVPEGVRDRWPYDGAIECIVAVAAYFAHHRRECCNLPDLYIALVKGEDSVISLLNEIAASDSPGGIPGLAASMVSTLKRDGGMWSGIAQELRRGLALVAPGEPCAQYMRQTDFDPAILKRQPTVAYLMSPMEALGGDAEKLHQIVTEELLRRVAAADGAVRVNIILDELETMGSMPGVFDIHQMLRTAGVRLHVLTQSRKKFEAKYSPDTRESYEGACEIVLACDIEEEGHLRDLEYLAGEVTVRVPTINASTGVNGSIGWTVTEQAVPLLSADAIRRLGPDKMLLRVRGFPMFVVDRVPCYRILETADLPDIRTIGPSTVLELPESIVSQLKKASSTSNSHNAGDA